VKAILHCESIDGRSKAAISRERNQSRMMFSFAPWRLQFLAAVFYSRRAASFPVCLIALMATVAISGAGEAPLKPASTLPALKETATTKPPWGRIVMVGASATGGFTESEPLGGPTTWQYRLSRYVDAALSVPHEPVQNLGDRLFFVQPEAAGRYQIEQALKAQPTLVIGIDFLFWFCYGDGSADKDRLQRFEKGLKLLEDVRCPLVLGDIPDASGASNDMLLAEQIPSVEAMFASNRRLREWAATRKHVVIVSLSGFMRTVMADHALTIHGYTFPEGKTGMFLQSDKLHPSPAGCAVLALAILDAFQSTRPAHTASEVRWNPREVFRLVFNSPQGSPGRPAKQDGPPVPGGK
jgi:hypothetical protein